MSRYDMKMHRRSLGSLGLTSDVQPIETETWDYVQHKDFQLNLLQKTDKQPRVSPLIMTSERERLAYFRAYTTSPFKIQISQLFDYTGLFWIYAKNVLLRSVATNYIHMFLAGYNSDVHLFGARMIPICYGMSWQVIICGLLQLVASADFLAMNFHYCYSASLFKNPWYRCYRNWTKLNPIPKPYECYLLDDFRNITRTLEFAGNGTETSYSLKYNCYYMPKTDTLFTVSVLDYFLRRWKTLNVIEHFTPGISNSCILNYFVVWVVAALFYKQLYNKCLWKFFYRLHTFLNIVYIVTLIYLTLYSLEINVNKKWRDIERNNFEVTQVSPGRDSVLMTASNSLMYIVKALLYYKLKEFAEYSMNAPVYVSPLNPYPLFYLWSIYFNEFRFGPTYILLFYALNFISEMLVFIITYQLLIEVIVCEYDRAERRLTTAVISFMGLTLCLTLGYTTKMLLYVFTTAITSVTEVVVICWVYPASRLLDDMYFHYGTRAHKWFKWSIHVLPCYFMYKTYVIFKSLTVDVHERRKLVNWQTSSINADFSPTKWVWIIGTLPLPLGAFFAIYKNVIKNKQTWRDLFNPRSDWGPREHLDRQLRKEFDSREYVGSQSLRYLSRHLMNKAQNTSYRLDICYGAVKRRSTVPKGYESEWENTQDDTDHIIK